jgi:WD repeat-containing protein 48
LAASMSSLSSDVDHPNSSPTHHLPHPYSTSGGVANSEDGDKLNGIPFDSLLKLVSSNDPFPSLCFYSYPSRARDPVVAILYSAASVMNVPRMSVGVYHHHQTPNRSPVQAAFGQPTQQRQLQHSSSIPGMNASRTEDTLTHSHSYTTTHTATSRPSHPILSHHPSLVHPLVQAPARISTIIRGWRIRL